MKIAVLGAAGVRTPLLVQSMARRQEQLGLKELALMDIDGERLELIAGLTAPLEQSGLVKFRLLHTTDAAQALTGADFVITTFRVGGIEARVIDERLPLQYGVLGQETTGPGGFAMGLRTIPVLLDYLRQMERCCPQAWLVNFANPAGMLAEAACQAGRWARVVGICDAPGMIGRVAAALVGAPEGDVFVDYFGLNHLGWARAVICSGRDYLPAFLQQIANAGGIPGLPFEPRFLNSLALIPNEYLFYYYHAAQAVQNMLRAGATRGERIAALNGQLFADLRQKRQQEDYDGMQAVYQAYLSRRGETYMVAETGHAHTLPGQDTSLASALAAAFAGEGYAGVALNLIEALSGAAPRQMIVNLPNQGAITGMAGGDVVEVPAYVGRDFIHPLAVGSIPAHCLGLMQQVKAYERLTIEAALQGSYAKALQALTIHPLVRDHGAAKAILDGYIAAHGGFLPGLS